MDEAGGSPCIGVCSTTYGDLICRGCYRFAHEVTQWNGYDGAQKAAVQARLDQLHDGAATRHLGTGRIGHLLALMPALRLSRDGRGRAATAYRVLRYLVLRRRPVPWSESDTGVAEGKRLLRNIDREIFERSQAHYERSFRILAE